MTLSQDHRASPLHPAPSIPHSWSRSCATFSKPSPPPSSSASSRLATNNPPCPSERPTSPAASPPPNHRSPHTKKEALSLAPVQCGQGYFWAGGALRRRRRLQRVPPRPSSALPASRVGKERSKHLHRSWMVSKFPLSGRMMFAHVADQGRSLRRCLLPRLGEDRW
ncbi:hypothetical protein VTI74DRAFT_3226 [Chaetomium olivicolor]